MSDTSIRVSDETRKALEKYEAPAHDTLDDTIQGLMTIVPPVEAIESGCNNPECDRNIAYDGHIENAGGVIWWWHSETMDLSVSEYFCSPECSREADEERQKYIPERPDRVFVGGATQPQSSFEGAWFFIDGQSREIGIDVAGAFTGYEGEPVYISNGGSIVQHGVVDSVIHEDGHTTLLLGYDGEMTRKHHPEKKV